MTIKMLYRGPLIEAGLKWLRLLLYDIEKMRSYDYGITAKLRIFHENVTE